MVKKTKADKETIIRDYVEAKMQLDKFKKEVDDKKDAVVAVLKATADNIAYVEDVSVYLRKTVKYSYSKKIALKEEALKADSEVLRIMKKEEEETGVAEVVEESFTPVVK